MVGLGADRLIFPLARAFATTISFLAKNQSAFSQSASQTWYRQDKDPARLVSGVKGGATSDFRSADDVFQGGSLACMLGCHLKTRKRWLRALR
jgi:hypothetical protein